MTLLNHSWSLLVFCLVLLTLPYWPQLPDLPWISVILTLTLFSLKYRWMRNLSLCLFAVLIASCHGHQAERQTQRLFANGLNITINGQVDSFFKQKSHGYEGTVVIRSINGQNLPRIGSTKIQLLSPIPLQINDQLVAQVRLKPIIGRLNQHGYDREAYAMVEGVSARASIDQKTPWRVVSRGSYQQQIKQAIDKQLSQASYYGLVLALIFGERQAISSDYWQGMKSTGLMHLIAISGLHIQLVFAIAIIVIRPLASRAFAARWLPYIGGLILAFGYAWLSNFAIPTLRALISCGLVTALSVANLRLAFKQQWLLVMVVMLLVSPMWALASSFWMSFSAVAVIYYTLTRHAHSGWLAQLLWLQAYFSLLLSPLSMYLFGGISAIGWAVNLIVVPWFSVIVMPSVLFVLAYELLIMIGGFEWVSGWGWLTWVFWPLEQVLLFEVNFWHSATQVGWKTSLLVALIVILLPIITLKACLFLATMTLTFWAGLDQVAPRWQMRIFDVGHGLAVAFHVKDRVILYDLGASWEQGSVAKSTIEPWLDWHGIKSIEAVFVSHDDNDHRGGLDDIQNKYSINRLYASAAQPNALPCIEGQTEVFDNLTFRVLWPIKAVRRAFNPHSCVIQVTDRVSGLSILLTGDIESVSEYLLARMGEGLQSDIMLVPHHGSRSSSTKALISRVKPQVAISSNAYKDRWKLPNKRVVERYLEQGAVWYDTGQDGMLIIDVYREHWDVRETRQGVNHSWYRQMLRNGVE
ncbi:DNA internalization-related competence protein ComEC/Rec2 [Vibrio sp. WXL210]|uniref:DNA internalization-related competence protein ComEC/Rec2 n=1 Tax=Vibrio sp. WXL210 TaxID=3450709 RepID=UPI003EC6294C